MGHLNDSGSGGLAGSAGSGGLAGLAGLAEAAARLRADGLDVVRISYPDLIGVDRGRDILTPSFERLAGDGIGFCRSIYATSPMGDVIPIEGGLGDGLPDVLAVPDLATLRPLPWEKGVAHVLADVYDPDGQPSAISPRTVLKRVLERWDELGQRPVVAPELEFFVFERDPAAASGWRSYGAAEGNVYVAGRKGDPANFALRALRALEPYDIGVYASNHEFASGQFEINLTHTDALAAADNAFRFKSAIQELARSEDLLATFMAKPVNDQSGSGFHLHFSTVGTGASGSSPLFDDPADPDGLSAAARSAIGAIIAHAPALAALLNPTVNSYKRFGPGTLAPWLIDWGLDNRSAMVRIPPERGRATRLELRLGDASANPYLVIAATLAAAYLGLRDKATAPPPVSGYGYDERLASVLPMSLDRSLDALEADIELVEILGETFVRAFVTYKRDELARFGRFVTDWEFREYAYHL